MPIFTADGHTYEARAQLPQKDVRLSDGRTLLLQGPLPLPIPGALWWITTNGMKVIGSIDETQHGRLLHVSVSYKSKDPTWAEIVAVRDAFYPDDIDVMMMLPKKQDYINLQKHCFHMQQTPVAWDCQ